MLERLFGRNPFTYTPTPEVKKPEYISLQLPLNMETILDDNQDAEDFQIDIEQVFTLLEKIDGVVIHPKPIGRDTSLRKCIDIPKDGKHQVFTENGYTFIVQPYEDHVIMFSKIHPDLGGETTIISKTDRFFIDHQEAYKQRIQENF